VQGTSKECSVPRHCGLRRENKVWLSNVCQRVPKCTKRASSDEEDFAKELGRRSDANDLASEAANPLWKPRPPCLPQIMESKSKRDIMAVCNHIIMTRHKQKQEKQKVSRPPPKSSDIDWEV
jgi:hypothetical protein